MSEVGNIRFKVGLNGKKEFTKEVNNMSNQVQGKLSSSFSKLGGVIAAAFSVTVITKFASACIKLASDLQEVQNVVDVTYKTMNGRVNEFAKTCALQYGLSEKMAKQYMGTFGSMAEAFGYTEAQAEQMSETLTGLTGDVASFYNLTQDEAYTKLKSVFTGETESLKSLGVVMTQSALDEFALANGFGKTTKQMSEQEKVALRLAFVTNALSNAQGDFSRTSGSWANQTKILSLQLDQLKTNLGDILINFLTPLLQALNKLIGYLVIATAKLKELLGIKSQETSGTGGAIAELSDEYTGLAESAEKASKAVFGFDNLNRLTSNSSQLAGGGAGGGLLSTIGSNGTTNSELEKTQNWLEKITSEIEKMQKAFIKTDVGQAFANYGQQIIKSCQKILNSIIELAKNIGIGFAEGLKKAIKNKSDLIKNTIIDVLTLDGDTFSRFGDFTSAISEIFSPLGGENGIRLWEKLDEILIDVWSILSKMRARIDNAFSKVLLDPIINNSTKLRDIFDDILKRLADALTPVEETLTQIGEDFDELWEEHISPFVDNISQGLTEVVGVLCDVYEQDIKPILDKMAEHWDALWNDHIKPFCDKFSDEFGDIIDTLGKLWNEVLKPLIEWLAKYVLPKVVGVLGTIWNVLSVVLGAVFDVLGDLMTVLSGLIDFITGVFTGDWEMAWNGLKDIVIGIVQSIWDTLVGLFQGLGELLEGLWDFCTFKVDLSGGSSNSVQTTNADGSVGGGRSRMNAHAIGGVIQPRNPHLAVLGDNQNEREVVSPLSTMKQAFQEALRENSMLLAGAGGGQFSIQNYIELGGRVVATNTNNINARDQKVRG